MENKIESIWIRGLRHLRRYYLIIFNPVYVMESLANRKGACLHCGCCESANCKHYDGINCNRWENLPLVCKLYPIDRKDMNEWSRKNCGYYWEQRKFKKK